MNRQIISLLLPLLAVLCMHTATAQTITSFPYQEDFESFTTCGTGCGASCVLSGGTHSWTNDAGDDLDWIVDIGGTSSSDTGPSADHTTGSSSGKYVYVETSCSGTGYPNKTASIESPQINLVGTNDIQFEFWYHMYGTSMGTMHVDVSVDNGANWSNDVVPAWTDNKDLWQQKTISLGAYVGKVATVRIRLITGPSFGGDAAIDDVKMYDLLANDAGIAAFANPFLPTCSYNDSVIVNLTNYGTDTLISATIDWKWNVTSQTSISWTGSLPPGESKPVFLGKRAYKDLDSLTAYTSLPNGIVEKASGANNDTISIVLQTGLKGTYTIGATGTYTTFSEAIDNLNNYGVCGAVVFDVEDGVYVEQITLREVLGMNAVNTVTFQAKNADPSLVTLEYAGTSNVDNFVVNMDGGDYYNFKNLTLSSTGNVFGKVVYIDNNASNNTWKNNIIRGNSNISTTSTNMALVFAPGGASLDSMNVFDNNVFENGSFSIYYYGFNPTSLESGTEITNNTMKDFYYRGVHIYYQNNLKLSGNTFTPSTLYAGAIYRVFIAYADGGTRVNNNKIYGNEYGYGMYFTNCDAINTKRGYVYNNFIHVGDATSSSTSYGIYLTACNNQVVTHNSVLMESNGASSRTLYVTGGNQNYIQNNILSNNGPGYGMYYVSGVISSNNNVISAPKGIPFYFGGDVADIDAWRGLTGFDLASDTINPMFTSSTDLHTCQDTFIDGGAFPDSMVLLDIDGQVRDLKNPDIGADEFLGLANLTFTSDTIWKCSKDTLLLGGWEPMDDASYLWNTTDTTPAITVKTPGNYDVVVTTGCGDVNPTVVVNEIPDGVAGFEFIQSFFTAATTNTSSGSISKYLWDFGDGYTTSDFSPTHLYSAEGVYVISLTVTGECGTDVYTDTMYASSVGVDEIVNNNTFNVYPNPTNGELNIDMGKVQNTSSVKVTSVLGQVVLTKTYGAMSIINLQIEGEPGLYFVEVTTGNGVSQVIKVLKK